MTASSNALESPAGVLALKEFAAHAAHEISNPLNAISINAELSLSLLKLGRVDEVAGLLKRMVDDCWSCGQQVRTFARLGEAVAQPVSHIELEPLLLDLCDAVARHARRPLADFAVTLEPELPLAKAESFSLTYTLTYLCRRLVTDGMRQLSIVGAATARSVVLRVHCENQPGTVHSATSRPLGVSFFERILGMHGIVLSWFTEGEPGFELILPR